MEGGISRKILAVWEASAVLAAAVLAGAALWLLPARTWYWYLILWLIGLALIVFGYAGASHISLELRRPAYQPVRQPRGGDRENDPAPLLPYLFAALPLIINLVIASQFFH